MVDMVSPGVQVKEKDLTTVVSSEPSSIGAVAIVASEGYVNEVVTIGSEEELVDNFGKPTTANFEYLFKSI